MTTTNYLSFLNKRKVLPLLVFGLLYSVFSMSVIRTGRNHPKDIGNQFIRYTADAKKQDVRLYWKDEKGVPFRSILNLKTWLAKRHRKLLLAMNAGMYKADHSAQGLYIENQQTLAVLDTASGAGNFYLKPNGVFYLTADSSATICVTPQFRQNGQVTYATQSGPMLLINGNVHPSFKANSVNMNIRNGVGILPDGRIVFAMSKEAISFYDFATYFKKLGCQNALYLDGFVSRTYLPEKEWTQTDGDFGVIIGVTTIAD